ncbi:MAG: diguanylate cyclase [Desulfuromonadaceae bacterium]|nr:diguanylate cyclase [Desulfuromonadaceae bacterium]
MPHSKQIRLTLTQKLIISYAINGICMVAALAYAIGGLSTMRGMVDEIARNDLTAITATITLRDTMLAQERTARRFVILRQPELIALHGRQSATFNQALETLRMRSDDVSYGRLTSVYTAYSLLGSKLFSGKKIEEAALVDAASRVELVIEKVRAGQQQRLKQKLEIAGEREANTAAWALGIALVGIALALGVNTIFAYAFSSSIGKLQKATHRIAAGDFDHEPNIPPGDEIGSLSMDFRRMAIRLKELEQLSLDASPLTRLPGNIAIERSISRRLRDRVPFAMCYLDLDNFKSYNDRYGYIRASELIKEAGQVIYTVVNSLKDPDAFVGHIGGDDFVVIISNVLATRACQAIIREFDAMVPAYYSEDDRAAGFIEGVDRYGVPRQFPLITISIAVLNCQPGNFATAAEIATAAAEVKDRVKESSGSNYIIVREAGSAAT